jgi:alkylation response protein AidB-like acyl-CoA dehydrogenase
VGEIITWAEAAACFASRAARAADGKLHEKADRRFEPPVLAAMSRVFAREAASKLVAEGMKIAGGDAGLEATLDAPALHRAQAGLLQDMDRIADALYGRGDAS